MIDWIRFGEVFIWFWICWFAVFYLHEQMHAWACRRYGGHPEIELWLYKGVIPSMSCSCRGSVDYSFFLYAGGLMSGFISITASILFYFLYMPVFIGLFTLGVTNVFYGMYEGRYRLKWDDDKYLAVHYYVELACILVALFILRNIILDWVIV